jgi:hypothetical protein
MLRIILLGGCALALSACASITRGTSEAVIFDSEPSGAEMRSIIDYPCGGPCPMKDEGLGSNTPYNTEKVQTPVVAGPACVTPCTIEVPRNQELVVTFTKPGYQPQTVKLGRAVSGKGGLATAGNVIAGGAVGLVTDAATGASTDHTPNPLRVVLVPIRETTAPLRPGTRKKQ